MSSGASPHKPRPSRNVSNPTSLSRSFSMQVRKPQATMRGVTNREEAHHLATLVIGYLSVAGATFMVISIVSLPSVSPGCTMYQHVSKCTPSRSRCTPARRSSITSRQRRSSRDPTDSHFDLLQLRRFAYKLVLNLAIANIFRSFDYPAYGTARDPPSIPANALRLTSFARPPLGLRQAHLMSCAASWASSQSTLRTCASFGAW
jgi:hypothetical protein